MLKPNRRGYRIVSPTRGFAAAASIGHVEQIQRADVPADIMCATIATETLRLRSTDPFDEIGGTGLSGNRFDGWSGSAQGLVIEPEH